MTSPQPIPEFQRAIAAAINYWRKETRLLDDAAMTRLDKERQNLFRAVQFGLRLPQTQTDTAAVILQVFDLIERRGYWGEWTTILKRALAVCDAANLPLQFKLLNHLGLLYRLNRQLVEAASMHEAAEGIARQLDDEEGLAQAHYHLGEDHYLSRRHNRAEAYSLQALASFRRREGTEKWIAGCLTTLGWVAYWRNEIADAEERFRQAVALRRSLRQTTELARALIALATALQSTQQIEEAHQCLAEAASLLEPTANEFDKLTVQNNLGFLYFRQGRWAEAETAFRQADSPYLRHSGNLHLQATTANNLGNALLKQGRFAEAEPHLRHALGLWRQLDDPVALANTLGTLGETLAILKQKETALPLFDEAIDLLAPFTEDAWARQLRENFIRQRQKLLGKDGDA